MTVNKYRSQQNKTEKRMKMRDWLEMKIYDPSYPNLVWIDEKEKTFRIPWKHGGRHGWREEEDARLFLEWSEHTGATPRDVKQHKANFRCALNSLRDVKELQNMNKQKGDDAYKVYQMLPKVSKKKNTKWIKKRKPSCATLKESHDHVTIRSYQQKNVGVSSHCFAKPSFSGCDSAREETQYPYELRVNASPLYKLNTQTEETSSHNPMPHENFSAQPPKHYSAFHRSSIAFDDRIPEVDGVVEHVQDQYSHLAFSFKTYDSYTPPSTSIDSSPINYPIKQLNQGGHVDVSNHLPDCGRIPLYYSKHDSYQMIEDIQPIYSEIFSHENIENETIVPNEACSSKGGSMNELKCDKMVPIHINDSNYKPMDEYFFKSEPEPVESGVIDPALSNARISLWSNDESSRNHVITMSHSNDYAGHIFGNDHMEETPIQVADFSSSHIYWCCENSPSASSGHSLPPASTLLPSFGNEASDWSCQHAVA